MNYHICDRCYVTRSQNFWVVYLSLNSSEVSGTSFHMYGSLYLPIFLSRDGSLTDENYFFNGSGSTLFLLPHNVKLFTVVA